MLLPDTRTPSARLRVSATTCHPANDPETASADATVYSPVSGWTPPGAISSSSTPPDGIVSVPVEVTHAVPEVTTLHVSFTAAGSDQSPTTSIAPSSIASDVAPASAPTFARPAPSFTSAPEQVTPLNVRSDATSRTFETPAPNTMLPEKSSPSSGCAMFFHFLSRYASVCRASKSFSGLS